VPVSRRWTSAAIAGFLLVGGGIAFWAARESAAEKSRMEEALRAEAALLARTLVPALAAASSSARELDEIVASKLLDNARLLARLDRAGALGDRDLDDLLDSNGLDLILVLDARGVPVRRAGAWQDAEEISDDRVRAVASGDAGEAILGWTSVEEESGHVAAVAARSGGGAVLVRTDATTAYAFARRIGVERLLEDTAGVGSVLYLTFAEDPGATYAAAWDDGDVPPPPGQAGAVRSVRDRQAFEVEMPVPMPAGRSGTLRVGLDAAPMLRAAAAATRRTTLAGAVLAAFGLAAAAFAVVSRARTLERADAARRLARAEESRRRSERLSAAGALAAGLAHEVRNPLNAIGMAAQRIERSHAGDAACGALSGRIRSEVSRLDEILKGFMDLARPASGPRKEEEIGDVVREVISLVEMEASAARSRITALPPPGEVRAVVDRESIRRALINLVRNALQASPPGGAVDVAWERHDGSARVVVADRGRGLDPAIAGRAFDPFVTSRAEGTGMGLALVKRVAEEHGGSAALRNRPGGGAEAILEIELGGESA